MIAVKKVGEESIPVIQHIVQLTWPVTYGPILSPEQLDYMIDLIYSTDSLKQQVQKGHQFILATEEDKVVGFASYSVKDVTRPSCFHLHKLYIDPGQQGKGIGKLLLDYIVEDIKSKGATDLELNVNRYNKALGFYNKIGFEIIREQDIDIGNGYFMNDYVMNLSLL
jgi:ribosomal protein S18 acetylase RimI-like enzyme